METTSTITSFSSPSSPPPARATPAELELEAVSLRRLSDNLERLLDPAFLDCADAEVVLADQQAGAVGVHRCILAARSAFFLAHLADKDTGGGTKKPRLELAALVPGGTRVGRDALVAVLGYLYTGRLRPPPQEAAVCVDDACAHEACRPAIDFVVQSTYAAAGFQIPELVSLFQRRLSDFVATALDEDVVPIVHAASTCQLHDLLAQCVQRLALSTLDARYLEKELPAETFSKIKDLRRSAFPDDSSETSIRSTPEKNDATLCWCN